MEILEADIFLIVYESKGRKPPGGSILFSEEMYETGGQGAFIIMS